MSTIALTLVALPQTGPILDDEEVPLSDSDLEPSQGLVHRNAASEIDSKSRGSDTKSKRKKVDVKCGGGASRVSSSFKSLSKPRQSEGDKAEQRRQMTVGQREEEDRYGGDGLAVGFESEIAASRRSESITSFFAYQDSSFKMSRTTHAQTSPTSEPCKPGRDNPMVNPLWILAGYTSEKAVTNSSRESSPETNGLPKRAAMAPLDLTRLKGKGKAQLDEAMEEDSLTGEMSLQV